MLLVTLRICRLQHKTCGKCVLFTDNEYDDALAMKEAAFTMKQQAEAEGIQVSAATLNTSLSPLPSWNYSVCPSVELKWRQ